MYILGITGSIAMGKTTVAEMFESFGFPAFYADAVVHTLFEKRKRLVDQIKREFPKSVKKGTVDRAALSKAVFGNPEKLSRLEHIVHPYVLAEANKFLKHHKKKKTPMVVLDIPLLFEIHANDICNAVLVTTSDPKTQLKRGKKRKNFSEENFKARIARQLSDEEKRKRADFVIDTSSSKAETRKEVEKLIAKLPL